jgi:S-adenosylmethionine synthetase
MVKIEINKTHIDALKKQKRIVGLLQFQYRDDKNFAKWYSLTENLIIKTFGQKSNQLNQLNRLHNSIPRSNDIIFDHRKVFDIKDLKEKLKDLLENLVAELELDLTSEDKETRVTKKGTSIKIKNSQTQSQSINITLTIEQIINNIKEVESDPQRVSEAEVKLKELDSELKSKSPVWSKVKDILIWLLNFGRDTFLQVLPIILERYKQ